MREYTNNGDQVLNSLESKAAADIPILEFVHSLPQVCVFLVAGPSGSGKTTLSSLIVTCRSAVCLSLDRYYLDESEIEIVGSDEYSSSRQWDSPSSCDFPLLTLNVQQLVDNHCTQIPRFSFFENRRVGYEPLEIEIGQPLVIEGLHAIRYEDTLRAMGLSTATIFVTADEQIRTERILARDLRERGRSQEDFDRRFHFMRKAEVQWVMEQQGYANWVIETNVSFSLRPRER